MEPLDWMWLATREMLLQGCNAESYNMTHVGNNKYTFDVDAGYEYMIQQYIEAFGPKFDLTKYRTYGTSEQFRNSHWKGRGALSFTDAVKRRAFTSEGCLNRRRPTRAGICMAWSWIKTALSLILSKVRF